MEKLRTSMGPGWMWLEEVDVDIDEAAEERTGGVEDARMALDYLDEPMGSVDIARAVELARGAEILEWFEGRVELWEERRRSADFDWEHLPLGLRMCDSMVLAQTLLATKESGRASSKEASLALYGTLGGMIETAEAQWQVSGLGAVAEAMRKESLRIMTGLSGREVRDYYATMLDLIRASDEECGWTSGVWKRMTDVVREENKDIILERIKALRVNTPSEHEWESERTFGAEIEIVFDLPLSASGRALIAKALLDKLGLGVGRLGYSQWKITQDGSVKGEHKWDHGQGLELVSPILKGENGVREYEVVLEALRGIGARVNHRCGAHFHIGASELAGADALSHRRVRAVVASYAYNEELLNQWVAPHRLQGKFRGETICRDREDFDAWAWKLLSAPTEARGKENEEGVMVESLLWARGKWHKESKINLWPLYTLGTVEFRQLEGTLSSKRAITWLRAMMQIVDNAVRCYSDITVLEGPDLKARPVAAMSLLSQKSETVSAWEPPAGHSQTALPEKGRKIGRV